MPDDPVPPAVRRRNLILGSAIGGACLALIIACMAVFSARGLPKDPAVWKRQQQDHQAPQP